MNINNFFTPEEQELIVQAIRDAELATSGEIRLHLEKYCKGDPLERAITIFRKLKMHETALHNGTLIYLAIKDKKFAIFGDEGINKVVPENFWEDTRDMMQEHFRKGEFYQGLTQAIAMVGEKLKSYFPHQSDDVNELSDDISVGVGEE